MVLAISRIESLLIEQKSGDISDLVKPGSISGMEIREIITILRICVTKRRGVWNVGLDTLASGEINSCWDLDRVEGGRRGGGR